MPAIITHDFFGQDIYKTLHSFIGESRDEYHAFLLGCQGPDPLFYSVLVPRLHRVTHLGTTMHSEKPNELLVGFKQSLSLLSPDEAAAGRAYVFGFLCHYMLDATIHPLVFAHEYRLCDAGIEGFDRKDGAEVHAVIESEFDEILLFVKKQQTVADFSPVAEILRGSAFVLSTISKMHAYVAMVVYGKPTPELMFASAIKSFRRTEAVFHSRSGIKRELLGRIEEVFRPYSFVRSMSPRAIEATESIFDNHERSLWEDPFTGKPSTASFWDLYEFAQEKASAAIPRIDREDFDLSMAASITDNLNFSGEPVVAVLTVENAG